MLVERLLGLLVLELVLALLLLELELLAAPVLLVLVPGPALQLLVADDVELLVPPFFAFLALLGLFSPRPFFVAFARLPPFVGVVELLLLVKLAVEIPRAYTSRAIYGARLRSRGRCVWSDVRYV